MKTDLHLHTNMSDGSISPTELVIKAKKNNIKIISITDHDTVDGIEEGIEIGIKEGIEVIPGIEFGSYIGDSEVHVLGYFLNYKSRLLIEKLNEIRENRVKRCYNIIEKLRVVGLKLSLEEILNKTNSVSIGRPHIAKLLVDKNYVSSIEEAFNKYLKKGMPGYADKEKIDLSDIIDLIHTVKGAAVLAHPGATTDINWEKQIDSYRFDGIEVYHPKHNIVFREKFRRIAMDKNKVITGGSDSHYYSDSNNSEFGKYSVEIENIEKLREISKSL